MRKGHDIKVLINEDKNELVGFCLGADYCSEHEWGIKKLHADFSLGNPNLKGLNKRIISVLPPIGLDNKEWCNVLHTFSIGKSKHYLMYAPQDNISYYIKEKEVSELHLWSKRESDKKDRIDYHMAGAWDEGSFGILVDSPLKPYLDELYQAFLKKDIAIFLGGSGPFKNAGLSICIASRLPKEVTKQWMDFDVDHENLMKASNALGIEEILRRAGKEWMALSPRWCEDKAKANTIYDVWYWLNPMHQDENNYGWFTVEDLMLWAVNNGPIPKRSTK